MKCPCLKVTSWNNDTFYCGGSDGLTLLLVLFESHSSEEKTEAQGQQGEDPE